MDYRPRAPGRATEPTLPYGGSSPTRAPFLIPRRVGCLPAMLKKAFRWLLYTVGFLLVLLAVVVGGLLYYAQNNHRRAVQEAADELGLDVTFARADITAWSTYPEVTLVLDSLEVYDCDYRDAHEPLLRARRLVGCASLADIWSYRIKLNRFTLEDATITVGADTTGRFRLGRPPTPAAPQDTSSSASFFRPGFDWQHMDVTLRRVAVDVHNPIKDKHFVAYVDSLYTSPYRNERNELTLAARLGATITGLGFNTTKGKFLENTYVTGTLPLRQEDDTWVLDSTVLDVTLDSITDQYALSLRLNRRADEGLTLFAQSEAAHYDRVMAILPAETRERLKDFHVSGTIPASVAVFERPRDQKNTEIRLNFAAAGQSVKLKQYRFHDVHLTGSLVNRLPEEEGGEPGGRKNLRIAIGPTRAVYDQMQLTSPGGVIRGVGPAVRLTAPVHVTGDGAAINRQLATTNFFFRGGRFVLDTYVDDQDLRDRDEVISQADGTFVVRGTDVRYPSAGVTVPLEELDLRKRGQDIRFDLATEPLSTGFRFRLDGDLDNITPLLLYRPADSVRTRVNLTAPRLSWTDFRAIFTDGGYLDDTTTIANQLPVTLNADAAGAQVQGKGDKEQGTDTGAADNSQAMKKALRGLQASFRPELNLTIDTIAYYDALTATNFRSGVRFDGDTIVLERTTFNWEGADVQLNAHLGLAESDRTPFRLRLLTEHLDLNRLRPGLQAFGLSFPADLDRFPTDLTADFTHRGVINDTLGIQPGTNRGALRFHDGRQGMFTGSVNYRPTPEGLSTQLALDGNPAVINDLVRAENFFFGDGHFRIDLDLLGFPTDLPGLVAASDLQLRIDSSEVTYRPADVSIPVRSLRFDGREDHATYAIRLLSDAPDRAVDLTGTMDKFSAFLYPESDRIFRLRSDLSARNLHWDELASLVGLGPSSPAPKKTKPRTRVPAQTTPPPTDTTDFEIRDIVSARDGVFTLFRPDLSVRVDTFWTKAGPPLTELRAGLRMRDSSELILEQSGFRLGPGQISIKGDYDIDRRRRSPFNAEWAVDSLVSADLLTTLRALKLPGLDSLGEMTGILTTAGRLRGRLDERTQTLLFDSTAADLTFRLDDLALIDWPSLRAAGKRAFMEKRFARLGFAPLSGQLEVVDGELRLPRTEVQSTALQLFVQGTLNRASGPDLLIAVPLRANIARGVLATAPAPTGYARTGWKVYLVYEPGKDGQPKMKFRLGRRKFYKDRGRLGELRALRKAEKAARKARR